MLNKEQMSLREIQLAMLEVLKEIHQICEENHLTYYIAYGTLLGAVRHNGFIPWDDDTDIWMPREDFEKFKEIFRQSNYKIGNLKFCNRANTEKYMFYLPRVSDTRYQYIMEKSQQPIGDMGVFVDIYPMDTVEAYDDKVRRIRKKIGNINGMYRFYIDYKESSSPIKTILKAPLHFILRFIYGKNYPKRVDARVEKLIAQIAQENGNILALLGWEIENELHYDAAKCKERILVDFEDTKVWAPKEYDYILKLIYGDYMQLPDEEARNPHHEYIIVKK